MTDFDKITAYYRAFDEWGRLDDSHGRLEFDITMPILCHMLPEGAEILDLGGGPGRYTIELARLGYAMNLADLSPDLLDQARARVAAEGVENVKSIEQVNATDLRRYADDSFDAVLLFGPLYHLTQEAEREACAGEVARVLRPGGQVFVSFIPYLAGATGVAQRMFLFPDQVTPDTLDAAFASGVFHNAASRGFQEGYYPKSAEICELFARHGFREALLRSIRGFGSGKEEQVYRVGKENPAAYEVFMKWIERTADDPALVETCAHALYVGEKL